MRTYADECGRLLGSDAVIRKWKQKNQQIAQELLEEKKKTEEMKKSVVSWKKSQKDRHDKKIEQVTATSV
jgi:hypothetical protein